jgi:type IV secretory pathway TrbF-like protein
MSFFRRRQFDEDGGHGNPLNNDETVGVLTRLIRAWQCGAVVGWVFAAAAGIGVLVVASQARDILHIVEVYPGAQVVYRGSAATTEIKDIWVETQIRQWIDWVRRRTDDPFNDKIMRQRALNMTTGEATKKLEEYYARVVGLEEGELKHNRMRVNVHVLEDDRPNSLTRDNPSQYRIRWQEEWTPTIGTQSHMIQLDGMFMVEHRLKTPNFLGQFTIQVKDMTASPLGVFIKYFDWDEAASPTVALAKP